MKALPDEVLKAWETRERSVVFSTVDPRGVVNAVYASCVSLYGKDTVVIANNYFDKTLKNIQSGSQGSVVFLTDKRDSYQIKGPIEYVTEGPIYDDMKSWNPKEHPGHGAAVVRVEEVYKGSKKLL
ncbi:MAG: pyridoxamine 5'-phosphate oxidase family protein [Spirochaetales bacterium]|nr:pyridoxamine 5'-phosphate oxidase family protein [Spirochaetales bacterium]